MTLLLIAGLMTASRANAKGGRGAPPLMPDSSADGYHRASERESSFSDGVEPIAKAERKPESYATVRAQERENYFQRPNVASRFSLMSGITDVSSSANYQKVNHTLYLGLGADMHFRYVGVDLDTYYGTASADYGALGGALQRSGSLKQYGGLLNVNFEVPLEIPEFLVVPKLGIGYGLMALSLNQDIALGGSTTGVRGGYEQFIHGPYVIAGLRLEPFKLLIISGDYATSLTTGGRFNGGVSTVNVEVGSGQGKFERIRAGAHIRLGRHVLLGFQFIQRYLNVEMPLGLNANGGLSPKQRHYLGVLSFEL